MVSALNKKEALLTKKERLLREIAELDNTIESITEEEWKEQGEIIIKNIDSLLELVPTHDDGTVDEGHDDPSCLKCVLLSAQMAGKWLYKDYGINIALELRKNEPVKKDTNKKQDKQKNKLGRPPKKKNLSENQKKAQELGLIKPDGTPKRILEVDESTVDLPENW